MEQKLDYGTVRTQYRILALTRLMLVLHALVSYIWCIPYHVIITCITHSLSIWWHQTGWRFCRRWRTSWTLPQQCLGHHLWWWIRWTWCQCHLSSAGLSWPRLKWLHIASALCHFTTAYTYYFYRCHPKTFSLLWTGKWFNSKTISAMFWQGKPIGRLP